MSKSLSTVMITALAFVFLSFSSVALAADIQLEEPIVVTTCGKSPGALMVKLIAKKAGLNAEQNDNITAEQLAATPCKTLIITMGSSGKGLGAAGTDIDKEAVRTKQLIEKAHSMGIKVVGTQFEGMSRRTDAADDISIDAVAPLSDALMVKNDSDSDGRFTKIAKDKGIPLYSVKQPMEIVPTLKQLFNK